MKRFAKTLQAGNTVEFDLTYTVNDAFTDLEQGDNLIIAIYNINRRCLYSASIADGKIVKEETTGHYKLTLNFEDTVNMPDRTIMEMVVKTSDGIVKHTEDDVMILWNNNNINDFLR